MHQLQFTWAILLTSRWFTGLPAPEGGKTFLFCADVFPPPVAPMLLMRSISAIWRRCSDKKSRWFTGLDPVEEPEPELDWVDPPEPPPPTVSGLQLPRAAATSPMWPCCLELGLRNGLTWAVLLFLELLGSSGRATLRGPAGWPPPLPPAGLSSFLALGSETSLLMGVIFSCKKKHFQFNCEWYSCNINVIQWKNDKIPIKGWDIRIKAIIVK